MASDQTCNYSVLDLPLQRVHQSKIKLCAISEREANDLLNKVKEKVKTKFKESNSFLYLLRNGENCRGSYFNGVKVGRPDEFDIDFKLKLPFNGCYSLVEIENSVNPGYIKVNIKKAYEHFSSNPSWLEKYEPLKKFMDKDGYLLETLFRAEIERVFQKQFTSGTFNLDLDGLIVEATIKKSGPAFTFHIEFEDKIIDIDFVFVLCFSEDVWPPPPVKPFAKFPKKYVLDWFAVPKKTDCPQDWRLSFPKHENHYLGRANNLKFIYRLLKAFRDSEKWNLASYHIATLFLWESELAENSENFKFWQQSTGNLFIYMLKKLSVALEKKELPFFWEPNFNMLQDIKSITLTNMNNRINEIIKQINKRCINQTTIDKEELETYIVTKVFRCKL